METLCKARSVGFEVPDTILRMISDTYNSAVWALGTTCPESQVPHNSFRNVDYSTSK